ncbi:MAG TPA: SpoIIE family protein phosphatase [Terriglobales bacterium]|nr:SpoIIE family protein phosphatase [Terriglobales bacterium]
MLRTINGTRLSARWLQLFRLRAYGNVYNRQDRMKRSLQLLPSPRRMWDRSSGLARLTMYMAGVQIFLYLTRHIFRIIGWSNAAQTLGGWIGLVGFAFLVLLFLLVLRWVRRRLMWSLRNRLIVTYIFIGVIPVILLLAIAIATGFLFTGQFATFLATSDISARLENLASANTALADQIATRYENGVPAEFVLTVPRNGHFPRRQLTVWYRDRATAADDSGTVASNLNPTAKPPVEGDVSALVKDDGLFHLRAAKKVGTGKNAVTVISSVPLDGALLGTIVGDLGEVAITEGIIQIQRSGDSSGASNVENRGNNSANSLSVRAGSVPAPAIRLDRGVDFGAPISLLDWDSGQNIDGAVVISTRPSLLFRRLFANLGVNANAILVFLTALAIALGLLELLAIIIGVRLTRTMTGSVHQLYSATQRINRGDLSYRIQVRNRDQLAELETSFNSMSQSLERLLAEQKEKQRIESELAIAQEVQAQLFPRQIAHVTSLETHGLCRPARTVSGDYYDFLSLGDEKLGIAVGDISGKGISAALLMATIHSAVRVYEMGRVPAREQLVAAGAAAISAAAGSTSLMPATVIQSPAAVLSLLNRHLYHSTPPEKYATMFFGLWDGNTRTLTYSNGGHLPPFIVRHSGAIEKLDTGGTVVGLFDDMLYEEASVELHSGDLFVAYSDGLTEPENEFGEFGERRLIDVVRETRNLPLDRIAEAVTTSVLDWIGAAEQPDDITLVLAKAK